MSEQSIRDALGQVVARVFQQTAFLFPEAINLQDGIAFGDQDLICVSLSFSGERSGDISLILPTALCQELSANILGEDMTEDGAPEKGLDAAKETLNIIAGQLLIQVFGEKALFNLAAPEVGELAADGFFTAIKDKVYVCSMVDDHPIIAALNMKMDAYEHTSTGC